MLAHSDRGSAGERFLSPAVYWLYAHVVKILSVLLMLSPIILLATYANHGGYAAAAAACFFLILLVLLLITGRDIKRYGNKKYDNSGSPGDYHWEEVHSHSECFFDSPVEKDHRDHKYEHESHHHYEHHDSWHDSVDSHHTGDADYSCGESYDYCDAGSCGCDFF